MSWQKEMDELRAREALARRMGGAEKVRRQHDGGKLTVRERIEQLLDPASFHEIGAIAGKAAYDAEGRPLRVHARKLCHGPRPDRRSKRRGRRR